MAGAGRSRTSLLIQETKLGDADAPEMPMRMLGYEMAHHGEGRWNGVAILSRVGIEDVVTNFGDGPVRDSAAGAAVAVSEDDFDPFDEARMVSAVCGGIRFVCLYAPNGRVVGSPFYEGKLRWFERVGRWLRRDRPPGEPLVIGGDYNVTPAPEDVWERGRAHGGTHVSPPEREALARLRDWGLVDAYRLAAAGARPLLVVGLPGRDVPSQRGDADRPPVRHPARRGAGGLGGDRPRGTQGPADAVRPRAGGHRPGRGGHAVRRRLGRRARADRRPHEAPPVTGESDRAAALDADAVAEDAVGWLAPGPLTDRVETPDAILSHRPLPHPFFGVVTRVRATDGDAVDALIARSRAWFAERGRTASTWMIGPSATPADLADRLVAAGAIEESTMTAMVLDHEPPPAPADVEIRRVATADEYRRSMEIVADAFGFDDSSRAAFVGGAAEAWPFWQTEPGRGYLLAHVDGIPVAEAGLAATIPGPVVLSGGATCPRGRAVAPTGRSSGGGGTRRCAAGRRSSSSRRPTIHGRSSSGSTSARLASSGRSATTSDQLRPLTRGCADRDARARRTHRPRTVPPDGDRPRARS